MEKTFVTATPPTPNGDLHIGHLAGPYLAADIYTKFKKMQGQDVSYITYGDDNQSYVPTTANNKNVNPVELVRDNNKIIKETLCAADIEVDLYKTPLGNEKHNKYVQSVFLKLFNSGKLKKKTKDILFCNSCNIHLFESFVKGHCPYCKSNSSGNLCEACGQVNDPIDLIDPTCTLCKTIPKKTQYTGLFFPLDDYREELLEFYSSRTTWRKQLIEFCIFLTSNKIPDYPVTYPSSWGIPVPIPEYEGQVVNVWFEMYPGILEMIETELSYEQKDNESGVVKPSLVQFLGFDNSFFNSCLHVATALALNNNALLPEHIITNYFYLFNEKKFSTSQGHALWGNDILKKIPSDNLRYHLALTNPEHMQTNFSLTEYYEYNASMVEKWEELLNKFFEVIRTDYNGAIPKREEIHYQSLGILTRTKTNLELYYNLDQFSIRKAVLELNDYMEAIRNFWKEKVLTSKQIDAVLYKNNLSDFFYFVASLALFSYPIMPKFSKRLLRNLGINENGLNWEDMLDINVQSDVGNETQFFFPAKDRELK